MTFLIVATFGAGVILIASALDNCPILATFLAVIRRGNVDWSGKGGKLSCGGGDKSTEKNQPAKKAA